MLLLGNSANGQMGQGDKERKDPDTSYEKGKSGEGDREASIKKG